MCPADSATLTITSTFASVESTDRLDAGVLLPSSTSPIVWVSETCAKRCVGGGALRCESLDRLFEQHVGMAEGVEIGTSYDIEDVADRRPGSIRVRSTRVLTNMPTRFSSARSVRPSIGEAMTTSVVAANRATVTASAAWNTHERGDPVVTGAPCDGGGDVVRQHGADHRARRIGDRRSQPVHRQVGDRGRTVEVGLPVRQFPGEDARGVARIAQCALLPEAVVGVLRQQFPAGRRARGARHVRSGQIGDEHARIHRRRRCGGPRSVPR